MDPHQNCVGYMVHDKVEEVQLQDPSNRKVVGRVYTPDEPGVP